MKVRTDKGKARDAREVHVVDDERPDPALTPQYCYQRAADELRSKNMPQTIYSSSGMGGSQIMYIPNTTVAKLWIDLGRELRELEEA